MFPHSIAGIIFALLVLGGIAYVITIFTGKDSSALRGYGLGILLAWLLPHGQLLAWIISIYFIIKGRRADQIASVALLSALILLFLLRHLLFYFSL